MKLGPLVLAFFGEQQCGKSTHAKHIRETFLNSIADKYFKGKFISDRPVSIVSFADPLYERLQIILPHIDVRTYPKNEPLPELAGRTIREQLQKDGEELRGGDFTNITTPEVPSKKMLASIVEQKIINNADNSTVICIDDLRHPDEYAMISEYNHLFIKMTNEATYEQQHGVGHPSEQSWQKFEEDIKLSNKKDLMSLVNNSEIIFDRVTQEKRI